MENSILILVFICIILAFCQKNNKSNNIIQINQSDTSNKTHIEFQQKLEDDFLDEDFKKIYDLVKLGKNIFITGGAGVGKSYYVSKLKKYFPDIVHTASTGVAAVNIGGSTIFSYLGIGIANKNPHEIAKNILDIRNHHLIKEQIKNLKILVIDEISMLNRYVFEYIDCILKDVRCSQLPFGGVQVILVGDFLQLPPVIRQNNKCDYINVCKCKKSINEQNDCLLRSYCFKSKLFENFEIINLTKIKRQKDDEHFSYILNKIRINNVDNEDIEFLNQVASTNGNANDNVIRIFPTKQQTRSYNAGRFLRIRNPQRIIVSHDSVYDFNKNLLWNKNFNDNIDKKFKDDYNLRRDFNIKVDSRVMLLKNLNVKKGLCNGSLGTVTDIANDYVIVIFDNGVEECIYREEFEYINYSQEKIYIRKQIPLMLAWAITVHKSQGITLKEACIDLARAFTDGQAYVALSRLTSSKGLHLDSPIMINSLMQNDLALDWHEAKNLFTPPTPKL